MTAPRIAIVLLAAGASVGGCVAVAVGAQAPARDKAAARPVDAPTAFAVFRRPAMAGDRMPAEARRILAPVTEREGVAPDRARAVAPSAGRAVWAIPGPDKVCLALPDPVDGFGINCADVAAASDGRLWVTLVGLRGQRAGDARLALFVPDGVASVTALGGSGNERSIDVVDNVAFADLADASSVSFADERGVHRVPVSGTPAALVADGG